MKIERLTEYSPEIANRVRELLIQLSRSKKDRGEIPEKFSRIRLCLRAVRAAENAAKTD